MMILLTYDVNLTTESGKKRLHKIAKLCEKYGIRVQNSVFEISVDNVQLIELKSKILNIVDEEYDSVRIYKLSKKWSENLEIIGLGKGFNQDDTLIF